MECEETMGGVPTGIQLGKQTGLRHRNEYPVQIGFINLSQILGSGFIDVLTGTGLNAAFLLVVDFCNGLCLLH